MAVNVVDSILSALCRNLNSDPPLPIGKIVVLCSGSPPLPGPVSKFGPGMFTWDCIFIEPSMQKGVYCLSNEEVTLKFPVHFNLVPYCRRPGHGDVVARLVRRLSARHFITVDRNRAHTVCAYKFHFFNYGRGTERHLENIATEASTASHKDSIFK